jgi:hypothetical protein
VKTRPRAWLVAGCGNGSAQEQGEGVACSGKREGEVEAGGWACKAGWAKPKEREIREFFLFLFILKLLQCGFQKHLNFFSILNKTNHHIKGCAAA